MKLFSKKPNTTAVTAFIYEQIRRKKSVRVNKCLVTHIERYEQSRGIKLLSNSFSDAVCEDFICYLQSRKLLKSTIKGYVDAIFSVFRKIKRAGYEVDFSFENVKSGKESSTTVYLTRTEIDNIYSMKIANKRRRLVRDIFITGCYTGLRFSDLSKLSDKNIVGNIIKKKTQKTGETVEIPIHSYVREIIKKHDGFPRYESSIFNFNKVLKTICRHSSINDKVLIERTRSGKVERFTKKKCDLVSSHTARRSFATNAYLAGIPTAKIMLMTGHKTEQSFFSYIRIGKTENARELAKHPFFNS